MSRLQTSHSEMAIFGPFLTFTIGRLPLTSRGRQSATISHFLARRRSNIPDPQFTVDTSRPTGSCLAENQAFSQLRLTRMLLQRAAPRWAKNYGNDSIGEIPIS